jgi:acetyl-CoA carboxylase biotin carboxyl carrier protein
MVPGAAAHGPPPAYQQVPRNIDDDEGAGLPAGTLEITSPMVGTFYRSSAPDADPFVDVGVRIEEEDVICIIEAMKVMNEIKAEFGGEIVEILVENGEPVEFGQPLFLVQTR